MIRRLDLLREGIELLLGHDASLPDFAGDRTLVPYCFYNVSRTGLALRANEGGPLGDAPQRLTKVSCTAHERHLECVLADVVLLISGREYLRLVDVVNANGLENLGRDRNIHDQSDGGMMKAEMNIPAPRQNALSALSP